MSDITIDQQFIEYVVKTLVGNPDAVEIERTIDEKGVLLLLTVDPEDLGRVIGKRGATAQSMRTLLRALGTKNEARYNLKIVDNGYPKPERDGRRDDDSSETPESEERPSDAKMQKPAKPADEEAPSEPKVEEPNVESLSTEEPEPVEEEAKVEVEEEVQEESAVERTRRELEDLDDLDI